MATFIMVTGAAPGLGKSTLVHALGDRVAALGGDVVVFPEAMIAEREEFADVISEFRATGAASAPTLLEATRRFAATYRESSAVVVQDMLFPYMPSLLAWGYADTEIVEFLVEIKSACFDIQLLQIHLDGSPELSVPRAIEREGSSWLDWMISKVSGYGDAVAPVTDLDSLVAYFERARRRTLGLLAKAPWPVVVIDADRGQGEVIDDATNAVITTLRRTASR